MQWNPSTNHRMLLISAGMVLLAMALFGPRSIWGVLGVIPLLLGMVGPGPLFQISGRRGRSRG
jgi:membrane-bound ClpP family serine protease